MRIGGGSEGGYAHGGVLRVGMRWGGSEDGYALGGGRTTMHISTV